MKKRMIFICMIAVVSAFLLAGCGRKDAYVISGETLDESLADASSVDETVLDSGPSATIYVDVDGAVSQPGVYSLPDNARVFDAVDAAGGLLSEACSEILNQAEHVSDGQKLYIITKEEWEVQKEPGGSQEWTVTQEGTGKQGQNGTQGTQKQAEQDDGYRAELEKLSKEKGSAFLHQMLMEVDPKSAENIHENNVKRVIRALEFYHQNGSPISAHNEEQQEHTSPYKLAYFVLNAPRKLLYERIDRRVDEMMDKGLVSEVQRLKDMGYHRGMVSMQGLGYKEILAYLDGEMSLEEAVRILKRDTRHFAKRQLTWFRREPETVWVNKDQFAYQDEKMLEYMLQICRERFA